MSNIVITIICCVITSCVSVWRFGGDLEDKYYILGKDHWTCTASARTSPEGVLPVTEECTQYTKTEKRDGQQ